MRAGGVKAAKTAATKGSKPAAATSKAGGEGAAEDAAARAAMGGKKGAKEPAADGGSQREHFTEEECALVRRELLHWYDHNHRVLPWRRTPHSKKGTEQQDGAAAAAAAAAPAPDPPAKGKGGKGAAAAAAAAEAAGPAEPAPAELPAQQFAYWVWVSEIMLQQTQVATVTPYFKRWVARWPTVTDLAAAGIEEVNSLWAGLGYYRRARYLLDGAKYVAEKLGGSFPTTAAEMLKIPGVGPYTAAAVSSIAFSHPAAVVDGNVVRVVSRLRALAGDPTRLGAAHTAMAAELLDRERPGCYNQALMELGATVCRPVNPDCAACPVRGACKAAAQWDRYLAKGGAPDVEDAPRVTQYPGRKAVKGKREQAVAVCVLEVICSVQQQQQQAAAAAPAAGAGAEGAKEGAAGAAACQAPRKRQRTMQDFALAAAARKQQQQQEGGGETAGGAAGGAAGGSGAGGGGVDLAALVAKGTRHYLLVQRPQEGLLAGLWEFPGAIAHDYTPGAGAEDDEEEDDGEEGDAKKGQPPSAPTLAARQRLTGELLGKLLGPGVELPAAAGADAGAAAAGSSAAGAHGASGGKARGQEEAAAGAAEQAGQAERRVLQVLGRHDVGTHVHVFSHIRQTNHVQRVTAVFHGDLADLQRATGARAAAAGAGAAGAGAGAGAGPDGSKAAGAGGEAGEEKGEEVRKEEAAEGADGEPRRFSGRAAAAAAAEGGDAVDADEAAADDADVVMVDGEEAGEAGAKEGAGKGAAGKTPGKAQRGKAKGAAKGGKGAAGGGGAGGEQGPAALMWVTRQQLEGTCLALSSGVKKIFELAAGRVEPPGGAAGGKKKAEGGAAKQEGEGKKRAAPGAGGKKKA